MQRDSATQNRMIYCSKVPFQIKALKLCHFSSGGIALCLHGIFSVFLVCLSLTVFMLLLWLMSVAIFMTCMRHLGFLFVMKFIQIWPAQCSLQGNVATNNFLWLGFRVTGEFSVTRNNMAGLAID